MQHSHYLELQQIGTRTMLVVAPRGVAMGTDELHIGIGGTVYDTYGKSVLLSRAQVEDLHGWLTRWLAEGWDGVKPVLGPTSADIIEHYRDVAVREQVHADRERIDGARRLAAALSLVPAEILPDQPELETIASQQASEWQHLQDDADRGEQARLIFVTGLHQIEQALEHRDGLRALGQATDDAETNLGKIRKALRKLAERGAHPAKR
jgi:hypothetical protein